MKYSNKSINILALSLFYIVFFLTLLTTTAHANLRDVKTTRLLSTAGAGIGSLLLNEAALLNPASIYFFQKSSFYYQKGKSSLDESSLRGQDYKDAENEVILLTDTSSALKGGFSYQTQSENGHFRKRFSSSAASNWGKNSSVGMIYRYTEEDAERHDVYHQAVFGYTKVQNKKFSYGAVLVDPFLSNKEDTLLAFGAQYMLTQNFTIMGDAGANYKKEAEENSFYAAAVQAQFFKSFFLRVGRYEDKRIGLAGNSWGLSWVGPRLSLDYAFQSSDAKADDDTKPFFAGEQLEEHSLALTVIF